MMFQIVTRDPITLQETNREVRRYRSRAAARRMVAQYAAQLSRGVESYCSPSVAEYRENSGYDGIQVTNYGSQKTVRIAVEPAKGGR